MPIEQMEQECWKVMSPQQLFLQAITAGILHHLLDQITKSLTNPRRQLSTLFSELNKMTLTTDLKN